MVGWGEVSMSGPHASTIENYVFAVYIDMHFIMAHSHGPCSKERYIMNGDVFVCFINKGSHPVIKAN